MKFDLTDEQQTIQRTVEEILADRVTGERLRARLDDGRPDVALWDELRALGFAGLTVPEAHGGQGLGLLELGLVCEALGAALAPVPLLANAATGLLVHATGDEHQRAALLPAIADGGAPASFAVLRDGVDPLAIDADGDGPLVVVADGRAWIAGPATDIEPVQTIDLLRRYRRVRAGEGGVALPGDPGAAVDAIEILLAAELTGVAQRALDLAVAYAKEREQFGRKIGSFQGVSHRCATMLLDVETARSTWRYACWVAGNQPDQLALATSTAKAAAVTAACNATAGSLQVLGGIGFTWEHDVHLLLRRARVGAQVLGSASEHRRRIARHLGDVRIQKTATAAPLEVMPR
jgi:alkylation response protein AidB-like acyl-CoA dehydrogenase